MYDFADTVVADKYVLEREVGRGGMATVWLARDLVHQRPVAVKILRHELAGAMGVDRFVREVLLTARLQHPNIVPILDSGALTTPDGASLPWYAMAYLEGESLRDRMQREPLVPIDEALRITHAVGSALHAAHQHGIIHRDIKPENVFLTGDQVYVVDFGIAKALLDTAVNPLTSTGIAVGTPAYMSPEQGLAGEVDARTDQYSLATILYEMLAGETPFVAKNSQAVIARRIAEPARPLRSVRSTVPPMVERAMLKALERAPADRFRDVNAFLAALSGESPEAPAFFRSRAFVAVVVVGLLIIAAIAAWALTSGMRTGSERAIDSTSLALYQRGIRAYDRRTPRGIVEAINEFNAAIARDSSNALAWAALAKAYIRAEQRGFDVPGATLDSMRLRAVFAVDRALELNAKSADAWLTQGIVSLQIDPTDWGPPSRALQQAMQLDSTIAPAWHFLGLSLAQSGEMDAAVDAWRRCVQLDPSYTQGVAFLALAHYWRQQFDSAARWADSAVALEPNNYELGRMTVGLVSIERGDLERARAAFDAARRLSSGVEIANAIAGGVVATARLGRGVEARAMMKEADSIALSYKPTRIHTAVFLAQAHTALGETDQAIAWLGRYEIPRDLHFQLHLRCDPPFAALAADSRFRSLLRPIASKGYSCGTRPPATAAK